MQSSKLWITTGSSKRIHKRELNYWYEVYTKNKKKSE